MIMQLDVRLFGGLTERAGSSTITVEVELPATAEAVRDAVSEQYPVLGALDRVRLAVDLEVATSDTPVEATSELALLPPVAGGSGDDVPDAEELHTRVRAIGNTHVLTGLHAAPLPLRAALRAVADDAVGASVVFVGSVRDHAHDLDNVVRLDYSAYEPMASKVLDEIADEIASAHPDVRGVILLHALGELEVGDDTIVIACTSAHRAAAFAACEQALEDVKRRVPIWKREVTVDGAHRWVGLDDH